MYLGADPEVPAGMVKVRGAASALGGATAAITLSTISSAAEGGAGAASGPVGSGSTGVGCGLGASGAGSSKGNRGPLASSSIAARIFSKFSLTIAAAFFLGVTCAAKSFSRARTGPSYWVTRSNRFTACWAVALAAWLPATSITLPAASRTPCRPALAAEDKAITPSRNALAASVRTSSS